jgi:hypothetical protein
MADHPTEANASPSPWSSTSGSRGSPQSMASYDIPPDGQLPERGTAFILGPALRTERYGTPPRPLREDAQEMTGVPSGTVNVDAAPTTNDSHTLQPAAALRTASARPPSSRSSLANSYEGRSTVDLSDRTARRPRFTRTASSTNTPPSRLTPTGETINVHGFDFATRRTSVDATDGTLRARRGSAQREAALRNHEHGER